MAKILARSLNCVNGPTVTPCGECEGCRTIAAGTSLDVIEMDAASNRSVDDIRELRERVGYAPATGHWKVYILDEAHMLTKEAWNAFLKTLEEPPPNTVFVLATTEPQKVMATIVDRCQRFDFNRPSVEQISEVINRVASAEGIEADDGAVALVARSASGSFRDALGTLDQLVSYGDEKVTVDDVLALLGAADADLIFGTVDSIAAGDAKGALGAAEQLARAGRDPATFAKDLIAHLRQLIVVSTTGQIPDSFSVTISEPERLREQADRIDDATIIGAIDALSAAIANIREGDDPRLSLEVALLKVARPSLDSSREALLRRIERLESATPATGGAGASTTRPSASPSPAETADTDNASSGAAPTPDEARAGSAPPPPDASGLGGDAPAPPAPAATVEPDAAATVDLDKVMSMWPAVVDHVRESGAEMLSTLFEGAKPVAVDADKSVLRIGFPPSATFNKRKAEAKANVDRFADALRAIVGERLRPVYELLDSDPEPEAKSGGIGDEEMIELIKTKFDASELTDDSPQADAK
jgi:DNA polymerase-3 subunit gamma/tau